MRTFEEWAEGKLGQRYVGDTSLCAEAYDAGAESARADERAVITTAVEILCESKGGAAVNAITEDYPEIAESIHKLRALPAALREGLQLPKYLADRYDNAVEKAESVGALKMLKNAEAEVGRWFIKQQALLNPAAASTPEK